MIYVRMSFVINFLAHIRTYIRMYVCINSTYIDPFLVTQHLLFLFLFFPGAVPQCGHDGSRLCLDW